MPAFSHDGLEFFWRETGAGLPFFFQHGLGADVAQPFGLFAPPEGVRLLGMDCRAHGQTRPVGNPDQIDIGCFADDLRALADHLKIQRAVVGGISMGAAVALEFALRFPDRVTGLVLCRPAWLDERRRDNERLFARVAEFIRTHGTSGGAELFQQTPEFKSMLERSPDNAASLLRQFQQPRAVETAVRLERIPQYKPAFNRRDWQRIATPTLVLANRQDEIHPLAFGLELARGIPKAEFAELTPKWVDPARHQQELQRTLEGFLQQHFRLSGSFSG